MKKAWCFNQFIGYQKRKKRLKKGALAHNQETYTLYPGVLVCVFASFFNT